MAESKFSKKEGVLNAMPVKKGSRKDGTPYEVQQVVVELDGSYEMDGVLHTKVYFMLFDTSKNVKGKLDEFSIGDPISFSYVMKGGSYKKKDGTIGYDNAMMMVGIEHSAIDSKKPQSPNYPFKKPQPSPLPPAPVPVEDDGDDLPF